MKNKNGHKSQIKTKITALTWGVSWGWGEGGEDWDWWGSGGWAGGAELWDFGEGGTSFIFEISKRIENDITEMVQST